ncbi:hypothetical protein FISHEDRAFT_37531 [Fistulina hepatica ATCC 64428]|uniref:Uncharacterized protein n=1 Tax=Fistulina hepatica ATCC 64428 TaxID=1128425 RepID=A0A0D7AI71_9AGAR|nr:hypothetical protein FISHEDRAFT_37531 [Fistulina hepatica ATCC 64428]
MADALKQEGNALFAAQKWKLASKKYTAAIELDEKNAILYANRCACRLQMRMCVYMLLRVLKRATEFDPTYAKGWARLATAHDSLKEPHHSIKAWEKAIAALPVENLSSAEEKQKEQYTAGLKAAHTAQDALKRREKDLIILGAKDARMLPWEVAATMIPRLRAEGDTTSSAWRIYDANQDFQQALEWMRQLQFKSMKVGGQPATQMFGQQGALESLTNALLLDKRVFRMDNEFIQLYNKQVQFEAESRKAWVEGGTDTLKPAIKERLRKEGWDSVRPALTVTIRGFIMRGFMSAGLLGKHEAGIEFYTRSIELIEWIMAEYSDVPEDTRGAIFCTTFLRGVRDLRLEEYMQAYSSTKSASSLEVLRTNAQAILDEMDAVRPRAAAHRQVRVFYLCPYVLCAESWHRFTSTDNSMLGFCQMREGNALASSDPAAAREHYAKAGAKYLEACNYLPEDDETYAVYLCSALDNMRNGACATVRDTLAVYDRLGAALPKMQVLWAKSALAQQGRDQIIKMQLSHEKEVRRALANNQATLDSIVGVSYS